MNTAYKLHELLQATLVLAETPIMKLKENKNLLSEITKIVSTQNFDSIMNSLRNERINEENFRENPVGNLDPESIAFTKSYVNYQNINYDLFARNEKAEKFFSVLPSVKNTKPFSNSLIKEIAANVEKTSEAKNFKDVFNSIFSNKALQIGTSQDPTFITSYIDYSPYIYNYQSYLGIPTLSQTVDRPIEMALKKLPVIDFKDDRLDNYFKKYFQTENIKEKMVRFIRNSTLSPRGSLVTPTLDKEGKIKINVYNDTQFTYSVSPQYSRFNSNDNEYGISSVYLIGRVLQPGTTCHFYCPGFEPLFGIGKNKMIPLKNAAEAINIYLYTIKVLCIRAQVMVQKWGGEGQTDSLLSSMKKMSEQINSSLSLNTAVKLPEGADLTLLNNNLSEGFAKISPIIKEFQAILTGVAPDYLYGSDTAYSANSFNIQLSHQNIRSEIQESGIEPALRYIVNTCLLYDERLSDFRNMVNDFEIKFDTLYEPTGQEKVNEDKGKIDNIISMSGYPELIDIFKKEGLFPKDSDLPRVETEESPVNPMS